MKSRLRMFLAGGAFGVLAGAAIAALFDAPWAVVVGLFIPLPFTLAALFALSSRITPYTGLAVDSWITGATWSFADSAEGRKKNKPRPGWAVPVAMVKAATRDNPQAKWWLIGGVALIAAGPILWAITGSAFFATMALSLAAQGLILGAGGLLLIGLSVSSVTVLDRVDYALMSNDVDRAVRLAVEGLDEKDLRQWYLDNSDDEEILEAFAALAGADSASGGEEPAEEEVNDHG